MYSAIEIPANRLQSANAIPETDGVRCPGLGIDSQLNLTTKRTIIEVVFDLVAAMPARFRTKVDVKWLTDLYFLYFGTGIVEYEYTPTGWSTVRKQPVASIERLLRIVGTPDIVTWSAWIILLKHLQSNAPLVFEEAGSAESVALRA